MKKEDYIVIDVDDIYKLMNLEFILFEEKVIKPAEYAIDNPDKSKYIKNTKLIRNTQSKIYRILDRITKDPKMRKNIKKGAAFYMFEDEEDQIREFKKDLKQFGFTISNKKKGKKYGL